MPFLRPVLERLALLGFKPSNIPPDFLEMDLERAASVLPPVIQEESTLGKKIGDMNNEQKQWVLAALLFAHLQERELKAHWKESGGLLASRESMDQSVLFELEAESKRRFKALLRMVDVCLTVVEELVQQAWLMDQRHAWCLHNWSVYEKQQGLLWSCYEDPMYGPDMNFNGAFTKMVIAELG